MKKTHTRTVEFTVHDLREALCAYLHLHNSSFPVDGVDVLITGTPDTALSLSWTETVEVEQPK